MARRGIVRANVLLFPLLQTQIEIRLQDMPSWVMAIMSALGVVLVLLLVFLLLLCILAPLAFLGIKPKFNKILDSLHRVEEQLGPPRTRLLKSDTPMEGSH